MSFGTREGLERGGSRKWAGVEEESGPKGNTEEKNAV